MLGFDNVAYMDHAMVSQESSEMILGWPVLLRTKLMTKQFERVSAQTNGARLQGIAVSWLKHVHGEQCTWPFNNMAKSHQPSV